MRLEIILIIELAQSTRSYSARTGIKINVHSLDAFSDIYYRNH